MTYGWAILIIAVVLGVLFQLGVFGGSNFGNTATAGSCQVQKTSAGSSLVGECQGLVPKFVVQFNGQCCSSYISATPTATVTSFTVSGWVYFSQPLATWGTFFETNAFDFEKYGSGAYGAGDNGIVLRWHDTTLLTNSIVPQNTWVFIVATRSGSIGTLYVNGQSLASGSVNSLSIPLSSGIRIGSAGLSGVGGQDPWPGSIADVQIYNASLSASEVLALYQEGIGGAPIRPQNITAWWPLNGNINDYSGNNNNGAIAGGTSWVSSWQNGYTAP